VDIHLISHLLGHSSVLVTEKVYAKLLLPTLSKELNEKLSFAEFMID
jgi:integrase